MNSDTTVFKLVLEILDIFSNTLRVKELFGPRVMLIVDTGDRTKF